MKKIIAEVAAVIMGILAFASVAHAQVFPPNLWRNVAGAIVPQSYTQPVGNGSTNAYFGHATILSCTGCVGSGSSVFPWPWTTTTHYGATVNSTSTPSWFINGIEASTTSYFDTVAVNNQSHFTNGITASSSSRFDTANITNLTVGTCTGCGGGGGGGITWPWTPATNYGVAVQSTSTPAWYTAGVQASSTSYFDGLTANTTNVGALTASGATDVQNLTVHGTCTGCGGGGTDTWTQSGNFLYPTDSSVWGAHIDSGSHNMFQNPGTLFLNSNSYLSAYPANVSASGDSPLYIASGYSWNAGDYKGMIAFSGANGYTPSNKVADIALHYYSGSHPSAVGLSFFTHSDSSVSTPLVEMLSITNNVGVNNPAPAYTLDVGGDVNTSGSYRAAGTAGLSTSVTYLKDVSTSCVMVFSGGILTSITGAGCP